MWELDHIVPIELFDLQQEEELSLCLNYQNIMPMYKDDNKSKGMSIHFSELKIKSLPKTIITEKLLTICQKELLRYKKYLP